MKSKVSLFQISVLLIIFSFFCVSLSEGYEKIPSPKGAVNDFAGVLSLQYSQAMERLAREVFEKTGTAVVVAIVESIENTDPAEYANRLYEKWGIGKKGQDKGVLIFLALKERKVRIETGYGTEGILPDGLVGEILDTYVVPHLRNNDYNKGLANALAAVSSVIAKDANVTLSGQPTASRFIKQRASTGSNIVSLIIFFIVVSFLLGTRRGRSILPLLLLMLLMGGSRGGGGSFGGFGGGFGGFGGGMSGGGGAGRGF